MEDILEDLVQIFKIYEMQLAIHDTLTNVLKSLLQHEEHEEKWRQIEEGFIQLLQYDEMQQRSCCDIQNKLNTVIVEEKVGNLEDIKRPIEKMTKVQNDLSRHLRTQVFSSVYGQPHLGLQVSFDFVFLGK